MDNLRPRVWEMRGRFYLPRHDSETGLHAVIQADSPPTHVHPRSSATTTTASTNAMLPTWRFHNSDMSLVFAQQACVDCEQHSQMQPHIRVVRRNAPLLGNRLQELSGHPCIAPGRRALLYEVVLRAE